MGRSYRRGRLPFPPSRFQERSRRLFSLMPPGAAGGKIERIERISTKKSSGAAIIVHPCPVDDGSSSSGSLPFLTIFTSLFTSLELPRPGAHSPARAAAADASQADGQAARGSPKQGPH